MELQVVKGEELCLEELKALYQLDCEVYEAKYAGVFENMEKRFARNPKTFVAVRDGDNGRMAAYMNFVPMTEALYRSVFFESDEIRDDDIMPEEIADYEPGKDHHLFIISMVVSPAYRDQKDVVRTLTDAFIGYLNGLIGQGYPIASVSGAAVSDDGKRMLARLWFRIEKELGDGNILYVCDGDRLKRLLENRIYIKTFRDDLYMLIPYVDEPGNEKLARLMEKQEEPDEEIPRALVEALDDSFQYECWNEVTRDLKLIYLGEESLLVTTDEYEGEDDAEIVVGEETAYLLLTAHIPSHMYVLTVFVPNNRFSTSQLLDQMSFSYLKIRTGMVNGKYHYRDLDVYLEEQYGLILCGQGKALLDMSNRPASEQEFMNILAGEVYNSVRINYFVGFEELRQMCHTNLAKYDYYEAYMSDTVIAMVLTEFSPDLMERIAITATYLFIADLIMFENTSIAAVSKKMSDAFYNGGAVNYAGIGELYESFGKTMPFWDTNNFKYSATQDEAVQIQEKFSNKKLKETYLEQQAFLERTVDIRMAQSEKKTGMILAVLSGLCLFSTLIDGYSYINTFDWILSTKVIFLLANKIFPICICAIIFVICINLFRKK